MKLAVASWMIEFLKQFRDSVSKLDYEALRSAFVLRHYPKRPDFDFHKYMIRALEHDFKRVVGISWNHWLFVILFLLLNINGMAQILLVSFLASVSTACCRCKAGAHYYLISPRGSDIVIR